MTSVIGDSQERKYTTLSCPLQYRVHSVNKVGMSSLEFKNAQDDHFYSRRKGGGHWGRGIVK